jgi:hypothetical protein
MNDYYSEQPQPSLEERVSVLLENIQPRQRIALSMKILEEQAILACEASKDYSLSGWRVWGANEERSRFDIAVDNLIIKN